MSEHEVYILDADPERVVSVTVGELRELWRDAYPPTIHERTCHFVWHDMTPCDGAPDLTEPDGEYRCSACGKAPDIDVQNAIDTMQADYYPSAIPEAIPVCPICGARVVGA